MIRIAETTAVSKGVGALTDGSGPRIRPFRNIRCPPSHCGRSHGNQCEAGEQLHFAFLMEEPFVANNYLVH